MYTFKLKKSAISVNEPQPSTLTAVQGTAAETDGTSSEDDDWI